VQWPLPRGIGAGVHSRLPLAGIVGCRYLELRPAIA
jgi:hypothetical protein